MGETVNRWVAVERLHIRAIGPLAGRIESVTHLGPVRFHHFADLTKVTLM